MGLVRAIWEKGDERVQWQEEVVESGDSPANTSLREAGRIFGQQHARGATAFRMEPGKQTSRIEQFDRHAEQMNLVPWVGGG